VRSQFSAPRSRLSIWQSHSAGTIYTWFKVTASHDTTATDVTYILRSSASTDSGVRVKCCSRQVGPIQKTQGHFRAVLSRKVSMPKNCSLFFYELEPLACTRIRIVLSNEISRKFWREDQAISQYLCTTHKTADITYTPCGVRALKFLFKESCSVSYFVATAVALFYGCYVMHVTAEVFG
jgi:hypothetical protein